MRAILAGAALTAFFVTPTLADYYIVQEPSTKRCRIVEERPAPGVGVVIGGVGSGFEQKLKLRMRTECRETGTTGSDVTIGRSPRPIKVARHLVQRSPADAVARARRGEAPSGAPVLLRRSAPR